MIELENLRVEREGKSILVVPSLSFVDGQSYGIIGGNGSGKTTLLRVLAGWIKQDHGTVRGTENLNIGYMPQKPFIFAIPAIQNVIASLEEGDAEQEAIRALEKVGLENFANVRADKLSGGEAQRLALARLLVKPRQLLLLDEPTSATDIRGGEKIEKVLLDYWQETQCTFIMSTHSPAQALRLTNQVIFLEDGLVVEQGPSEEVLHNPQDPRTRSFLRHWKL